MHTSVQFLVFAVSPSFRVFEQKYSLCFQIGKIRNVFLTIKSRMISVLAKVVRTSGAGHLCAGDTVSGPGQKIIFPF